MNNNDGAAQTWTTPTLNEVSIGARTASGSVGALSEGGEYVNVNDPDDRIFGGS